MNIDLKYANEITFICQSKNKIKHHNIIGYISE